MISPPSRPPIQGSGIVIPLPTRSRDPANGKYFTIPKYLHSGAVWGIHTAKKMIGLLSDHGYELVAPIFDGAIIRRKAEATEIKSPLDAVMDATGVVLALKQFPS